MNPTEPLGTLQAASQGASPFPFQAIAIILLTLLLTLTVAAAVFKKATKWEALFWSCIWITGGIAIVRYDLSMSLARKLGIGRGADLLLYCAVGVMLVGFMMVYIRLRRLRREITLIVRHLALQEAGNGVTPPKKQN